MAENPGMEVEAAQAGLRIQGGDFASARTAEALKSSGSTSAAAARVELFEMLTRQQREFSEQLEELQRLLAVQRECTSENALEEVITARIVGVNQAWQKPPEELPLQATKALEEAFSVKDSVTKAEARDLGSLLGITPTQVKDFFAARRAHTRAWIRRMHPGSPKGRRKSAPGWEGLLEVGQPKTGIKPPGQRSNGQVPAAATLRPGRAEKSGLRSQELKAPQFDRGPAKGPLFGSPGEEATECKEVKLPTVHGDAGNTAGAQEPHLRLGEPGGAVQGPQHSGLGTVDAIAAVKTDRGSGFELVPQGQGIGKQQSDQIAGGKDGGEYAAVKTKVDVEVGAPLCTAAEGMGKAPAGGSLSIEMLPLEPFHRNHKPRRISIDLNAPPRESMGDEPPGMPSVLTPMQSSDVPVPKGSPAATLAMAAPENRIAGVPRRVQPDAKDLRGQLSQLVGPKESAGHGEGRGERLVNVMRAEDSVAGRLQILEALTKARKRVVNARLLEGAGLTVLHQWLVEGSREEQTSLLHQLIKVLDLLPLPLTAATPGPSLLKSLLKLTHYFVPDVAASAQQLLLKWQRGASGSSPSGQHPSHRPARQAEVQGGTPPSPKTSASAVVLTREGPLKRKRRDSSSPSLPRPPPPAYPSAVTPPAAPVAASPATSAPPLARASHVPAKRAGAPLKAPPGKQVQQEEGPQRHANGLEKGGNRQGRFAELLQKGRRREKQAEVAQLLQGAVQSQSDRGEKPMSADDILKAKARQHLIRQMQGKNGSVKRDARWEDRGSREVESRGSGRAGRDMLARDSTAKRPTVAKERTAAGKDSSPGGQGAPLSDNYKPVHSNGDLQPEQASLGAISGSGGSLSNGGPPHDSVSASPASSRTPSPVIDLAAISALAQVLQVGPNGGAPAGALGAPAHAPDHKEGPEPAPSEGPPANPLLAQLVAEVERQKQRERERRAREGPQAGLSAEGARSAALLQQLEAQVAALVQQERRRGALHGGAGGGFARAVALMEDRAIPWQVPPAVPLDPAWNVPAGSDSEEVSRLAKQDGTTLEVVYPHPSLIPDQPRPLPAPEPDYDDRLTPEITTVDLKQQQQQGAVEAPAEEKEDEDAEYQAALAEAYGMGEVSTQQADESKGAPAPVQPPPLHTSQYPPLDFAPNYVSAALHSANGGAAGPWRAPPEWKPGAQAASPEYHHMSSYQGALPHAPPQYKSPVAYQTGPRGPQHAQGRAPLDRTPRKYGRDHGGPHEAPFQSYRARPARGSWPHW